MNESITIELPFNEAIERENQNFYFKYVWNKAFKSWKRIIVFTFLFLLLGFYPIKNFETNLLFYFFKYGGIFLCGYCFILIYQYFISKKKFKKELENLISEYKAQRHTSFMILNEKSIEFTNQSNSISSVKEKIYYTKQNDFLIINPLSSVYFIINKSECKNNEFETILSYLEKYSKPRK